MDGNNFIDLINNRRLLHTYHYNENKSSHFFHQPVRREVSYAHPLTCDWCKKIWIYRRRCLHCDQRYFHICGIHQKLDLCVVCHTGYLQAFYSTKSYSPFRSTHTVGTRTHTADSRSTENRYSSKDNDWDDWDTVE